MWVRVCVYGCVWVGVIVGVCRRGRAVNWGRGGRGGVLLVNSPVFEGGLSVSWFHGDFPLL